MTPSPVAHVNNTFFCVISSGTPRDKALNYTYSKKYV